MHPKLLYITITYKCIGIDGARTHIHPTLKNIPLLTPCNLCMFRFMMVFSSCFVMGRQIFNWINFAKSMRKKIAKFFGEKPD